MTVNPRRGVGVMEHSRAVGQRPRIPSDSRHLLGLRQALVRRGKQMSGRTHGEPRATRLLMGSPPAQTPALLWCRCSGHGGLRSSATSANDRLCALLICKRARRGTIGSCRQNAGRRRLRPSDWLCAGLDRGTGHRSASRRSLGTAGHMATNRPADASRPTLGRRGANAEPRASRPVDS